VKSATAGATMSTPGAFRQAEGGTLFLDEITGADFEVQEKIARALRDREIVPVGAGLPVTVNTRVVVASTVSLAEAVNEGTLSEELAGLLGETVIELPPLRDRREDVPHLVRHFVKKYAREFDAPEKEVLPDAMQLLLAYDWPGNVEELENAIEQAFKRGEAATIGAGDLPQAIRGRQTVQWTLAGKPVPSFEEAERSLIEVALEAARGKKAVAARYLQIDRQRLYRKIRKYHLDPNLGRK
jgi:DNA-binding NtrC family response regulator